MTAARERPILFSGAMVKAILEDRKVQTRRVVKPQPVPGRNGWFDWGYKHGAPKATSPRSCFWHGETWAKEGGSAPIDQYCPYGQPGEKLWVRETWATSADYDGVPLKGILYDRDPIYYRADGYELTFDHHGGKWRPGIFLPRWASRITLEITEVRVERLQDISEADAIAEGIRTEKLPPDPDNFHPPGSYGFISGIHPRGKGTIWPTPRGAYRELWGSINGKKAPWSSNPWLWVLAFRRITEAAGQ